MTITYQQLAYEQRCQISALKKSGCSPREIAEIIGTLNLVEQLLKPPPWDAFEHDLSNIVYGINYWQRLIVSLSQKHHNERGEMRI
ncbi:MAG: hypothetical protein QS721_12875 [Candidatus Endonucleobacter sp. (ex Gigantidas childressi)]|nr:hypothetical protein [Candidatus Endonucleobacter sp. (ex Gigantidas childressi)]